MGCLALMASSIAQTNISGKVMDTNNVGIPGVNITLKSDSSIGTSTDIEGNYSLAVPSNDAILVFSAIGMKTLEIPAHKASSVVMEEDSQILNEVVVVGFGSQKKENLTGAVSSVDEKILQDRPVNNVAQALQGAVAGVNFSIGNGGGELGNMANINIRGASSLGNTSSSPLILIDGVEGDLSSINPQDIKSISVLKDAASCSIYGSRGASGVILVTTKSGKSGKISINYNNNFRWSSPLLQPKMLDSESFAYYWNDAATNNGKEAVFSKEILEKIKQYKSGEINYATTWNSERKEWRNYTESFANVNWFKQFYKDWAPSQEHNISASGGSEKVTFYFSANWLGQEGLIRYNTDTRDRYSVNAKMTTNLSPSIKLNYNGKFSRIKYGRSSYGHALFYHNIARRWPTLPVYDPNGHYVYGNEIAHLNNGRNENEKDEFVQQLKFIVTPLKGWTTNIELNYKTGTSFNHTYILPIYAYNDKGEAEAKALQFGSFWSAGQSRILEYGGKWNYFSPNIYSEYKFSIADTHNIKVMGGFQSELNKSRGLNAWKNDVYSTTVLAINATYGDDGVGGYFNEWATAGFFTRINYDYKEKYLLELNGRYDGSSRYLKDKRWNFFPSFSLGWNISKEEFWENLGGFTKKINLFKLRGSYGELGNQNIMEQYNPNWYPFYQSMPLGSDNGSWLIGGKKTNTAYAPGLVSDLLTWERVASWNIGLDLNMFNNRLALVFDYFQRKTYDMVGPAPQLPVTLGTTVPKINNTDMESKGFELELSWRDNIGDNFSYGIKTTLTDSYATITKFPNENKLLKTFYSGQKRNDIWGFTTVGIAKTQKEMDTHIAKNNPSWGSNWSAGDIMYKDLNGDGKVNNGANTFEDHGDLSIIGNSTPRYNFGIDIDAQWKGFDFRIFLQGTAKRDVPVGGPYFSGANSNMWQSAGFTEHLDYFRPEDTKSPLGTNINSYYPRPLFGNGGKNFVTQTRWLQNGAYMRLKNISLGYTFPKALSEKVRMSKLRIYFSAENLLTFTKMTEIFDPETFGGGWGNGKIYPLSKVISCGVSLTF